MSDTPPIVFHLSGRSGVAPYMQLIQQVRHALRLGVLQEGDRLPTVKEVAAAVAVNPNTVLKAYRELEYEGLVAARPGRGTFVTRGLETTGDGHDRLLGELREWVRRARDGGLDDESIEALFAAAVAPPDREAAAS